MCSPTAQPSLDAMFMHDARCREPLFEPPFPSLFRAPQCAVQRLPHDSDKEVERAVSPHCPEIAALEFCRISIFSLWVP